MTMKIDYFIADVFTNRAFNGAQIAVLPDASALNTRQMQLIARELNLSETVFVIPGKQSERQWKMRIFSPLSEIDFAGHPIIATAYVLAESGQLDVSQQHTSFMLEQNAGSIDVSITADNGTPTSVQFTRSFTSTVDFFAPSDSELAKFLGLDVKHIESKQYSARVVACGGHPYLCVPLSSYEAVRSAVFNYASWSQSSAPQTAAQEILLFSDKNPFQDAEFNTRLVGPNIGIKEDPPVGSAMPAFGAYLGSFDHMRAGTYAYSVDRGDADSRRSVLNIELDNKNSDQLTLRVGGEAVMIAQGAISVPG